MTEDKQMPCGNCPAGTYALAAIEDGIELFRRCASRKSALAASPRCRFRQNQICMGCRDFLVAYFGGAILPELTSHKTALNPDKSPLNGPSDAEVAS